MDIKNGGFMSKQIVIDYNDRIKVKGGYKYKVKDNRQDLGYYSKRDIIQLEDMHN